MDKNVIWIAEAQKEMEKIQEERDEINAHLKKCGLGYIPSLVEVLIDE